MPLVGVVRRTRLVRLAAVPLSTATQGWLTAGGPHHTVLSTALSGEELTDLAEVFSTELVLIDADTTRRSLAKELRWSAAYHRLAQRL